MIFGINTGKNKVKFMKKITLICLACILSVILFLFISCDDVEDVKNAFESFENEVALIEKKYDAENGVENYKIKFSDGTTQELEVKTESTASIESAELDDLGSLILIMSDNTTRNLGMVRGEAGPKGETGDKGDKGQKGSQGDAGNSIDKIEFVGYDLKISYTDGTIETIENAREKDAWTIVYENFKRKYPSYTATEEEFIADVAVNLLFTTEYTVKFEAFGVDINIPDQKVAWGGKVKEPNIADYLNDERYTYETEGWYVGNEKWSFIGCVVTEDITLKASIDKICTHSQGFENESVTQDEATCEEASILISRCPVCQETKETVIEDALGHKWTSDAEESDGWITTTFLKRRQCLRSGCDKVEIEYLVTNLTNLATITATSEAGGHPELDKWQERLTDEDWRHTGVNARVGAPLVIELDFSAVQCIDADILAFSACGANEEGNQSAYKIYAVYKDVEEKVLISNGKIGSNDTEQSAIVVDFGENNKEIVKIQIVLDNPTNIDCFFEILVGRYISD